MARKYLDWQVNFTKGRNYQLSYSYQAPQVSPEFYLLGPLKIGVFSETRQWQVAVDATDPVVGFFSPPAVWTTTTTGNLDLPLA